MNVATRGGEPVAVSANEPGDQVSSLKPALVESEDRTVAELVEVAKNAIMAAKDAVSWKALVQAIQKKRLSGHEKVMRSYTRLARKDTSEADMVSALTNRHTIEDIASWISAMKDIENKGVKSIVAKLQVQNLADVAFTDLGLDRAASEAQKKVDPHLVNHHFFYCQDYVDWKDYVVQIETHDPAMTMIKTLTRFFVKGALANSLLLLRHTWPIEVSATKMLTAQIRYWVRTKVDPRKVEEWMLTAQIQYRVRTKVDSRKVEEWMLTDESYHFHLKQGLCRRYAVVSTWSAFDLATQDTLFKHEEVMRIYTELANKGMPPDVAMLSALKRGNTASEVVLAMDALKDVEDDRLKGDAAGLLNEQIEEWTRGTESPDVVFRLLELDQLKSLSDGHVLRADYAASFFLDPRFALWEAYLMGLHGGDLRKVMNIMRDTVDSIFNFNGLFVQLLRAAEPIFSRV
uniref:RxLR effector candidate protein n=1 Tax=Hyaloperonospora arabidopsidis (strain Emoy2) TaxID=559515 RepID=M4B2Y3_HYAAE